MSFPQPHPQIVIMQRVKSVSDPHFCCFFIPAEVDKALEFTEEVKCHEVFEEAVRVVPTVKMWTMYAEFCIERLERDGSVKICNQV